MKRGRLTPPKDLLPDEAAEWRDLDAVYAPFRISDSYAVDQKEQVPSFSEVSWCSLYALSVRLAEHVRKRGPLVEQELPSIPKELPWTSLHTRYDEERIRVIGNFRRFLADWGIQTLIENGLPATGRADQVDSGDANKVLGLHFFRRPAEVQQYVRRWHENPLIKSSLLRNHEFITHGAIDLICSELIENGFVHSGGAQTTKSVFLLGKICPVESCERDLRLHEELRHLSDFEVRLFRNSADRRIPHLQFVVGDLGCGIDGNTALRKQYSALQHAKKEPSGFDLIRYALRGDVTTKSVEQIRTDWRTRVEGLSDYTPAVHGLSEIRRYLQMLGGFWRIHSHQYVVQHDNVTGQGGTENWFGRYYPGCLHYFSIPLHRRVQPARRPPEHTSPVTEFENFDLARFVTETDKGPQLDHEAIWRALLHAGGKSGKPLLVLVYALETVDTPQVEALCPLIADALNRSFKARAVFFCGPNATFRSLLPRFTRNTSFLRPTNMVVFLGNDELTGEAITVCCAEEYAAVEPIISRLLTAPQDAELVPSDHVDETVRSKGSEVPVWPLIRALTDENPMFLITGTSGTEQVVRPRYYLGESVRVNRLLRGGRTFDEFALHLRRQGCVSSRLPDTEGYLRFGDRLHSYLHLGRLLADPKLSHAIPESFALQLRALPAMYPILARACDDFLIIALLHPAIEVAQEIFQRPQFSKAELVLLRRMADIYWDHGPLMACSGKTAVVIVDFIYSAQTIRRLLASLEYLGVEVVTVLSILTAKSDALDGLNVLSFCECARSEYDKFCAKEDSST